MKKILLIIFITLFVSGIFWIPRAFGFPSLFSVQGDIVAALISLILGGGAYLRFNRPQKK